MKPKHVFTLCNHCHEEILNRHKQAQWHGPDHPECYAAHNVYLRDQERKCREHQKDERRDLRPDKRRRTGKPCQQETCHRCKSRLLPQGYWYACPEFYSRQHNNIEGDYVYAAWGYAGHPRLKGAKEEMGVEEREKVEIERWSRLQVNIISKRIASLNHELDAIRSGRKKDEEI